MKKILLVTISIFTIFFTHAQTGGSCFKAISITSGTYVVDTMIAGAATFKDYNPYPTKAIWYKYVPTQDGLMNITSCGGGADTRLFIYEGTCDTAKLFGFNDDYCAKDASGEDVASDISKFVKSGTPYYIEWDNAWLDEKFAFSLTFAANPTPKLTQSCQTALTITPGTMMVDSLIGYATKSDAAHANWYKYTPAQNGKITLSACGEDVDTRVIVYKGTCGNMTVVDESDDDCNGILFDSIAAVISNLTVEAGTTYYFEWDDVGGNNPFDYIFTFDATSSLVDAALARGVQISPNPAQDYINVDINFDKTRDIDLKIYNTLGQVVTSQKKNAVMKDIEKIDVSHLQSGIYILEIIDGKSRANKKLMINR
jgi:hypothetical protein